MQNHSQLISKKQNTRPSSEKEFKKISQHDYLLNQAIVCSISGISGACAFYFFVAKQKN